METLVLPNVRKVFIPDPGYLIGECDLSGADAQVVAWEANDEELMDAFSKGLKIHIKNSRDIFPAETKGMSDEALKATDHPGGLYHNCKRGVHGTNYGASARTLAEKLGWTIREAERFQRNWFGLHPRIKAWHTTTEHKLFGRVPGNPARTISNKFGYRIIFFDRVSGLLPEALAWVPQSTVGINCSKGAVLAQSVVEVLLQVHDSFVFQTPIEGAEERIDKLGVLLHSVKVPYPRPLVIPWKLSISDKSWGDGVDRKWKFTS